MQTLIGLADIHGHISTLDRMAEILELADVVLLLGDLTHFGRQAQTAVVLEAVAQYNENILAVPGNCDYREVDEYLTARNVNLDGRSVSLYGVDFVGLGGSLPCPGTTPNEVPEGQLAARLDAVFASIPPRQSAILVAHQPPYDTIADHAAIGKHVGSRSVRAAIERYHPLVCLTGHIHEAVGVDSIKTCRIINPGPLRHGHYAKVILNDGPAGKVVRACEVCSI